MRGCEHVALLDLDERINEKILKFSVVRIRRENVKV